MSRDPTPAPVVTRTRGRVSCAARRKTRTASLKEETRRGSPSVCGDAPPTAAYRARAELCALGQRAGGEADLHAPSPRPSHQSRQRACGPSSLGRTPPLVSGWAWSRACLHARCTECVDGRRRPRARGRTWMKRKRIGRGASGRPVRRCGAQRGRGDREVLSSPKYEPGDEDSSASWTNAPTTTVLLSTAIESRTSSLESAIRARNRVNDSTWSESYGWRAVVNSLTSAGAKELDSLRCLYVRPPRADVIKGCAQEVSIILMAAIC